MRLALLVLLACAATARAEPTCGQLRPTRFAQLSSYAQKRLPGGDYLEGRKAAEWKTMQVTLTIDRAPHIARAILASCPGVVIVSLNPGDTARRSSYATVTVTAFSTLSRLAQLPAIRLISAHDTRRHFDFEDPLF